MKSYLISFCLSLFILLTGIACAGTHEQVKEVDICIYGGTSAGVIAAYTAKMSGKSVLLVEPRRNLGGMSSGGLGYTDIGNKYVVTGLALDFYRRLGTHYGKLEQWIFEPSVAEHIFNGYINRANVEVLYERRLKDVKKNGNRLHSITLEHTYGSPDQKEIRIRAKQFIDCTYEGDLMAKSGVSYTVGREANSLYGETWNGVQLLDGHQFHVDIDPYVIPGDPASGLLWGIRDAPLEPAGSGDKKVQAYNFRIALSNRPENRIEITEPENYHPSRYEILVRINEKKRFNSLHDIFIWSHMPNGKTDINNRNAFSTDMIGANWDYPEADYKERERIWQEHVDYTKGLLYFVGNDPRMPEEVRNEMKQWGYPKDEYVNNGHWSHQLYVREARRMIGEKVMTQHHCEGRETCTDAVGWAAYTMDSHNCDRQIVNGVVRNEGNVEVGGFNPYPISYRSITPKQSEAANLLVPVCLSASHIAYGSIRMEPVFMVLAQSAATAACLAIDKYENTVQNVDVNHLQQILAANPLADGTTPDILVDDDNRSLVTLTGNWETGSRHGYGLTYLFDESKGASLKSVRYQLPVKNAGNYTVYFYYPRLQGASSHIHTTISTPEETVEKTVYAKEIVIEGQTSGEWVSLGSYTFPTGNESYIEISNKGADGTVVADAILLVPEF
ncbi:MAG: FAD-dependent oxidoreductase [Tannerellaceae bacterium]|nr:FAD-dependent oxidoreductase [Tannerellaceae bacterium]